MTNVLTTPSFRIGFVKLVVKDLDAMVSFYEAALGLATVQAIETTAMSEKIMRKPGDDRGFSLILYRHKDDRRVTIGNAHGPVGFFVRDAAAAFRHALHAGAIAHREPFETAGGRAAFVLDPEGHELEFVQVGGDITKPSVQPA